MASVDSFPEWLTKVRKDPLGFASYNELLRRFGWVEALFGREHLLVDVGNSSTGEHNAAEIPREVGGLFVVAGPAIDIEGFRYAGPPSLPSTGTIRLVLDSAPYSSVNQMSLQVQNCSESGINKPTVTSAIIVDTSTVEFYSKVLTSALVFGLGAGNVWAAENANICVAIHGAPLNGSLAAIQGLSKMKGDFFSDASDDWNLQVINDAKLRAKFLADPFGPTHSSAGDHLCFEVAKTSADIFFQGGSYRIRETSARNPCASVTTVGAGHCQLVFTNAWALPAEPFVGVSYAASAGGVVGDTYVAVTPRSLITTTTVDVYLYKYDFPSKTWSRADTDFTITVYAS